MEISDRATCHELMSLMQRFKRSAFTVAESLHLTPVQLFALYWIYERGEMAMGQVASLLYCDASNVTGLVDRLMAQGLVTRQESAKDRRIKTLRLTPKGEEIIAHMFAELPHAVGYEKLTQEERAQLQRLLQRLAS